MALAYATEADLTAYTGEPAPAGAARLLREAAALVRFATRNDLYNVQPSGLPSDDDLREAMRDATCAQVTYWAANGVDPTSGATGGTPSVAATEVDGAKVQYSADPAEAAAAAARAASLTSLTGPAYAILRNAGLASA